jgi:hypothetical protein
MSNTRIIALTLCFFVLAPTVARTQDTAKDFYGHDFAASPLESQSSSNAPKIVDDTRSVRPEINREEESSGDQLSAESSQSSSVMAINPLQPESSTSSNSAQNSSSSSSEMPLGAGIKVERLGVVVNALQEDHTLEVLTQFRELVVDNKYAPGTMSFVGVTPVISSEPLALMIRRLLLLGAQTASNLTAPPVPAKRSPVWIFETAKGQFLVEGAMNPAKFINAKGEFVPPSTEGAGRPEL